MNALQGNRARGSRRRSRIGHGITSICLGVVALASACVRSSSPSGTNAPGAAEVAPEPRGPGEERGIAALRARLESVTHKRAEAVGAASQDGGRCEDLCQLATDICGVTEELCELAEEHPGDDAYQGLCREAGHECREAQDSCIRCVQTHGDARAADS